VGSLGKEYPNLEGRWISSIMRRKGTQRNIVGIAKENKDMDNRRIIKKKI